MAVRRGRRPAVPGLTRARAGLRSRDADVTRAARGRATGTPGPSETPQGLKPLWTRRGGGRSVLVPSSSRVIAEMQTD